MFSFFLPKEEEEEEKPPKKERDVPIHVKIFFFFSCCL